MVGCPFQGNLGIISSTFARLYRQKDPFRGLYWFYKGAPSNLIEPIETPNLGALYSVFNRLILPHCRKRDYDRLRLEGIPAICFFISRLSSRFASVPLYFLAKGFSSKRLFRALDLAFVMFGFYARTMVLTNPVFCIEDFGLITVVDRLVNFHIFPVP